jgi:hypothetical protein
MGDNAEDLVNRLRRELDDTESGAYLWSEDELYRYIDRAQRQFARLTNSFLDGNPSYFRVSVTAGSAVYSLNENVLNVEQAYLVDTGRPLRVRNSEELLLEAGTTFDWRVATGEPQYLVLDESANALQLVPVPDRNYELQLIVTRLPLREVTPDSIQLELTDFRHTDSLLLFAKHLAYSKHDVDTHDSELAAKYEMDFRRWCEEYRGEILRKRRRPGNVAYGGY